MPRADTSSISESSSEEDEDISRSASTSANTLSETSDGAGGSLTGTTAAGAGTTGRLHRRSGLHWNSRGRLHRQKYRLHRGNRRRRAFAIMKEMTALLTALTETTQGTVGSTMTSFLSDVADLGLATVPCTARISQNVQLGRDVVIQDHLNHTGSIENGVPV